MGIKAKSRKDKNEGMNQNERPITHLAYNLGNVERNTIKLIGKIKLKRCRL